MFMTIICFFNKVEYAFCRMAVEAMACGCQGITNDRVGANSWPDPIKASQVANDEFWRVVKDIPDKPNRRRVSRLFGFL